MTRKPHIAIIIGSTRAARFADKPTGWLLENAQKREDMSFELVDLRDYDLPLFDEVASNLWVPSQDPRAVKWQRKLAEFDGYVFVTSEYNHSVSGSLKNALDQAYNEWNRKPAAAMGYGGVGAARAIEHLRGIAVELQMVPLRNAVHLGGGDFFKVSPLGANGEMAEVEANLLPALDAMLDELRWWAEATMAQRAKTA
ncbi:NADPH-dependent FMN reductase [Paracoccus sp. MKU1]|uniref:NADPH-dependent FMN reductase n=1 Tax=Paracoccus sp. MKU1 TaxID=1745182 RepID=UPI0007190DBD|nr:NAD(P)H-dependent oxidoreductase [Paracoccus sp. MKU1]KRW94712.1 FMN reductase [Paracoccus sp. MKU1]